MGVAGDPFDPHEHSRVIKQGRALGPAPVFERGAAPLALTGQFPRDISDQKKGAARLYFVRLCRMRAHDRVPL